MKVALITRSTLYKVPGGDTLHVDATARHLASLGVDAQVIPAGERPSYHAFDLLHFFNITRPADILRHLGNHRLPYVVTPIWIDYAQYDRFRRPGWTGAMLRLLSPGQVEYAKTLGRWIKGNDARPPLLFFQKGQQRSIEYVLGGAALLLTNSEQEFETLREKFPGLPPHVNIPVGIEEETWIPDQGIQRDPDLVLCAARIEGLKNQLALIKSLNHTRYTLVLAGEPAPNQPGYYKACRKAAASNVHFAGRLSPSRLKQLYQQASVHVLPSWYESCGLSSLEAAAMGCNTVITRNGFAAAYFGEDAYYCEPGSQVSIFNAINEAANAEPRKGLAEKIRFTYTWRQAALQTKRAYQQVLETT